MLHDYQDIKHFFRIRRFRYNNKYYCKNCGKYYDKELIYRKIHCGVCKNMREKIRRYRRKSKPDYVRDFYNESRI